MGIGHDVGGIEQMVVWQVADSAPVVRKQQHAGHGTMPGAVAA